MGTQLSIRNQTMSTPAMRAVTVTPPARAARLASAANDFDVLDHIGSRMVLRRNQPLFHEGDEADNIYRVISGAIRTSRVMPDGRRYVADFLFPGDFIGLNEHHVRTVAAEALCDAILIRCSRRQFELHLDENRCLGRMILTILSGGLSSAQERMLLLGRKTAAERVASFLLMMAARRGSDRIELPMTREDIADYLGLTIETISRTISLFKAKNIIKTLAATTIVVQNRNALEDLAESC
jgi:CRP-like cAMP-binding protein